MASRRKSDISKKVQHNENASTTERRKSDTKVFRSELKMPQILKENDNITVSKSDGNDDSRETDVVIVKDNRKRHSIGSTGSRDSQPSRAERLRRSIVANSMSSLAPLYVTQILPPEQRVYPQVTYERTKGPGYVYILTESSATGFQGSLFKVGVTNNLKMRLRDIQNGNPRPLIPELLLKVFDMQAVEEYMIDVLEEQRSNLNGGQGWYKAETKEGQNILLDFVADVKKKHGGVEIPPEKFKDYMNYYINFET